MFQCDVCKHILSDKQPRWRFKDETLIGMEKIGFDLCQSCGPKKWLQDARVECSTELRAEWCLVCPADKPTKDWRHVHICVSDASLDFDLCAECVKAWEDAPDATLCQCLHLWETEPSADELMLEFAKNMQKMWSQMQ